MPAPQLALSKQASAVQSEVGNLTLRNEVLSDLIAGKSMLEIAQKRSLTEKEVQAFLHDALEQQTEFMKKNADTLQQSFYLQHQEMFQTARRAAYGIKLVDGVEVVPEGGLKIVDIYSFREMRASLQAMENILNKYMDKRDEGAKTLNVTIVDNTPLALLARRLIEQGMADETITISGS